MPVTTDFAGTETLAETKSRLGTLLTAYGYDSSGYSTWGDARTDLNSALTAIEETTISDGELASSFRSKLNALNAWSDYPAGGKVPNLVFDFEDEFYRSNDAETAFDDSITHSATTNATMVDSDGVLKWRPHNLLTYSEDFSNADWTKAGVTAAASSLVEDTSTGNHRILPLNGITVSAVSHTIAIDVKPAGRTRVKLTNNNLVGTTYDLIGSGSVVSGPGSITSLSDGWYRISTSGTSPTTERLVLYLDDGTGTSYTGDGSSGVFLRNARLYRSDLGGMVNNPDRGDSYVPTTSSAVYLPRRGHHVYNGTSWVNEGLLHESEQRVNLLTQSQDMTNAAWVTSLTNVTTTSVGNNTFNVVPSATNTQHRTSFDGDVAVSAGTYTLSVEAKANGYDYLGLTLYDGSYDAIVVSLVDGTVSHVQGTSTYTVQDVGNGFWRVSLTGVLTADLTDAAKASGFWPKPDASTAASTAYLADGTSGVLLRYPQFEAGSTPSSYIPTSGATVTRAAETLTVPAAKLPWPTPNVIGTNLDDDFSSYADQAAATSAGYAFANVVSFDATADAVVWEGVGEGQFSFDVASGYPNGTLILVTVAVSGATTGSIVFQNNFVSTPSLTTGGNIGTVSGVYEFICVKNGGLRFASAGEYDGQIDNISVREIDPLSVSIQMDGRVTYADIDAFNTRIFTEWRADSSNVINLKLDTVSGTGDAYFVQGASGTFDARQKTSAYAPGILVPYNIASRHGSTFINGATDGVALTADTTPVALPDLSTADLKLGFDYMGTIRTFRMWDQDLGDTGIEEASA